jgi:hypothetical protein
MDVAWLIGMMPAMAGSTMPIAAPVCPILRGIVRTRNDHRHWRT